MKRKLLNVRSHLEHEVLTLTDMLARDSKHAGGLVLAPIDRDNLRAMLLVAHAILRQHNDKNTRKDIYIEAKP